MLATLTLSETGTVQTAGWTATSSTTYTKTYTGNITSDIIVFENLYGTTGTQVATITRINRVAPVITVIGENPARVLQNGTYTDAGATANDDIDGNITTAITQSGTVNTTTTGSYLIEYSVTDSAGNE